MDYDINERLEDARKCDRLREVVHQQDIKIHTLRFKLNELKRQAGVLSPDIVIEFLKDTEVD